MLHGWIDMKARDNAGPFDITSATLMEELGFVARYLAVPVADEQSWNRLSKNSPPNRDSQIARQSRSIVQPLFKPLQSTTERIAIIGVAGTGKSEILRELYEECDDDSTHRVWIDAITAGNIEEVVAFGAWACAYTNRTLRVFVESVDHIAEPTALLGKLERALGQYPASIYAAFRPTTWGECRAQQTWTQTHLASWTEQTVLGMLLVHATPPVPNDLLEVLRTPLFLDLFVRTFRGQSALPPGVASRHGVLAAFFERTVFPSGHADVAQLRQALNLAVTETLDGRETWNDASPSARQLIALGVFSGVYGDCEFRHALLRDFAVGLYLSSRPMEGVVATLKGQADPTLRNDALRALIEIWSANNPMSKLCELGMVCASDDFGAAFAIAIGSIEAPSFALIEEIAQLDDGAVFLQAAQRACLQQHIGWISALAGSEQPRPSWVSPGSRQLEALGLIAALATASRPTSVEAFAKSLRAWTHGIELLTFRMLAILKLLTSVLPDDETLGWIVAIPSSGGSSALSISSLRTLLCSNTKLEPTLAFQAASHLMFCQGGSVARQNIGGEIYELFRTQESSSVLTARPSVAIPLLLKASVTETMVEDKLEEVWIAGLRLRYADAYQTFESAQDEPWRATQSRFRALQRILTLPLIDSDVDLVDDGKRCGRSSRIRIDEFIDRCKTQIQSEKLASNDDFYAAFAAATLASESVRARTTLLNISTSKGDLQTVGALLEDHRLYHFVSIRKQIVASIQELWTSFSAQTKGKIQSNILGVASSSTLVVYVGTLARAIPSDELNPELLPYIEANDSEGFDLVTFSDRPAQVSSSDELERDGVNVVADDDLDTNNAAIPDRYREYTMKIRRAHNDKAARDRVVDDMLANGQLSVDLPLELWGYIKIRIRDYKKNPIETNQVASLFDLAIDCATAAFHHNECDAWKDVIEVASLAAMHDSYKDNHVWRTKLFAAVVEAVGPRVERQEFGVAALQSVTSWHWFSSGPGPELFDSWVVNYLDPPSLLRAIVHLRDLPSTKMVEVLRATASRIDSDDLLSEEFCCQMGRLLAFDCFWQGESPVYDLLRDWKDPNARPLLLQSKRHWASLLQQYSWQLGCELAYAEDDFANAAAIDRFARLATQVWNVREPCNVKDIDASVTCILRPLHNDYEGPSRQWPSLLCNLVASILMANARALYGIAWEKFDIHSLEQVATAILFELTHSATQMEDRYYIIETATKVGLCKLLPSTAQALQTSLERLGLHNPHATAAARTLELHRRGST